MDVRGVGAMRSALVTVGETSANPMSIITFTSDAANNLNNLVNFGADGPNATPFQFVGTTAAQTSAALAALGIHSHGDLKSVASGKSVDLGRRRIITKNDRDILSQTAI